MSPTARHNTTPYTAQARSAPHPAPPQTRGLRLGRERPTAQDVLDIAGVMFVVLDADEKVALINKKGCEILGYPEEDVLGRNWFDAFLPPEGCEEVRGVFRELMSGAGEAAEYFENPVLTKSGTQRIISWHNAVLTDDAGPCGTLSSGMDVTELKRTEAERVRLAEEAAVAQTQARLAEERGRLIEELRELHSTRDRFYAMVNHELRNALTGVQGWSELLVRRNRENPLAREIIGASEYAIDMLNDLLDLSRLDAARLQPEVRSVDARELLLHAAKTVEPMAEESGVRIDADLGDGPVACKTDPKRLQQILVNLLRNAVLHSPDGSAVSVRLEADEAELTIAVRDWGEGIEPHQVEIIFDAYRQAESKAGGGAGLGLTVSRRLANLLGGDILVASVPGEGSTFTLTIARALAAR